MYNCDTVKSFWKQCKVFFERNMENSSKDICNISHQMIILGFPSNDALTSASTANTISNNFRANVCF